MEKIILCLLVTTVLYAQSVYEVTPGTKGNEVVLSIFNESKTDCADKIIVALSNTPRGIEICNNLVQINKLNPNEERDAVFSFDAKRIPPVQMDTLKFVITDEKGDRWDKEIVISYALPMEFRLEQNYPNPFNPATTIEYAIPQSGRYSLTVYNILGQVVKVLCDEVYEAGYYKVNFDASRLASGIYIYRLSGNNVNINKKMILLK